MPGGPAVKLYVTEPVPAAAVVVSEVSVPVSSVTGWAGCPSASTCAWPGKVIEVGSGRVLCRTTVTLTPESTQSVGPGSWNAPPLAA